jgi:23S rRNA (uridine2552-2'-O)-methyltransferase
MQVASAVVGRRGRVVGVDMARVDPPLELENAVAFEADLFDRETAARIVAELGGRANVVLCDAAPKLTGIRERDRAAEENLLEAVEATIPLIIQENGSLLVKLLECPEAAAFERRVRKQFNRAQAARTAATRKGSSERYLLARGWKPQRSPKPSGEAGADPVE